MSLEIAKFKFLQVLVRYTIQILKFFVYSHPSASRPVVTEAYSIVAIFDPVSCHPLVGIVAALDCSGHDNCACTKVNLKRTYSLR